MIAVTLAEVAEIVGGETITTDDVGTTPITGVSIDTRTIQPGNLFVPLTGENVDGHRFIVDAVERGAAGFFTAPDVELPDDDDVVSRAVVVDDPLDALTGLGRWIRTTVDPTVVCVTGSNGKTTTKDLIAAAIGATVETVANPGSFNNEIGTPLTLCSITDRTDVLVSEVGARGIGHIADAMPLLEPRIAVVTNVASAHLGKFGSIENIVTAKSELVEAIPADGVAVLNADDPNVAGMASLALGKVVTFGVENPATVTPETVTFDTAGVATMVVEGTTIRLPLPGRHHVLNALAAVAVGKILDVPMASIAEGIGAATVSKWRTDVATTENGVVVVNDAYNANTASMIAAFDTVGLMNTVGERVAVLGYMAELGTDENAEHHRVGEAAAKIFDTIIVVGDEAVGIADGAATAGFTGTVQCVRDVDAAIDLVGSLDVSTGDIVLVKASRSVGLERFAETLLKEEGSL